MIDQLSKDNPSNSTLQSYLEKQKRDLATELESFKKQKSDEKALRIQELEKVRT